MTQPLHDTSDPRNATILINVNGVMMPRAEAMVSVFDSGFMLGDGIWEGMRVQGGRIAFLDRHLDRLFEGTKAIALDIGLDRAALTARLYETIDANHMTDGGHIRLMVTRGIRSTPYQDPRVVVGGATIVIIAEYKQPPPELAVSGLNLFTVHVRRGDPAVQDPKLNSHSKLNCITACIQAAEAGADEALMLDPHGFVATCNSTHFFIVRQGRSMDLERRLLPRRDHPRKRHPDLPRGGHPCVRKELLADRCLWRRGSLLHRHLRGADSCAQRRRTRDQRRTGPDGRAAARTLCRADRGRCSRPVPPVTIRIAMWSGPRNLSTAMMRSFGSRADTTVTDEPFYGAYLKATGDPQAMAEQVIADMDCDWTSVARTLTGPSPDGAPIWYQKHMAHHMVGPIAQDDLPGLIHAFLIRDPARVVASYAAKREAVRPEHLGTARQVDYFNREADRLGHAPPVIDSADVLRDPEGTLAPAVRGAGHVVGSGNAALGSGASAPPTASGRRTGTARSPPAPASARPTPLPRPFGRSAKVADQCQPFYDLLKRTK